MKRLLIAGAVVMVLVAAPLGASSMPFATNIGGSMDTILAHGHGHGFGHSHGRHRGWSHSHHRW